MKETKPHKWSQAIYFVLASVVTLVLILVVAEMFFPLTSPELIPNRDALSSRLFTRLQDIPARFLSNPAREKILLALNHEKTIGKSKIIYRGLEGDSKFRIDVVILELDPQAFYGYRFSIGYALAQTLDQGPHIPDFLTSNDSKGGDKMDKKTVIFFSLFALLIIGGSLVISLWIFPLEARWNGSGMMTAKDFISVDHGPSILMFKGIE